MADAAGHAAILRQGVLQHEARHAQLAVAVVLNQEVVDLHEGFLAVVVVGVDHHEGLVQKALAGQNRLAGAPGLGAAFGQGYALRQVFLLLIGVGNLHAQAGAGGGNPVANGLAEGLGNVVPDDKDHLVEACFNGVVNGIVHDDFAVQAHGLQLLDSAAETAADARCHNNQGGLFGLAHDVLLLHSVYLF